MWTCLSLFFILMSCMLLCFIKTHYTNIISIPLIQVHNSDPKLANSTGYKPWNIISSGERCTSCSYKVLWLTSRWEDASGFRWCSYASKIWHQHKPFNRQCSLLERLHQALLPSSLKVDWSLAIQPSMLQVSKTYLGQLHYMNIKQNLFTFYG